MPCDHIGVCHAPFSVSSPVESPQPRLLSFSLPSLACSLLILLHESSRLCAHGNCSFSHPPPPLAAAVNCFSASSSFVARCCSVLGGFDIEHEEDEPKEARRAQDKRSQDLQGTCVRRLVVLKQKHHRKRR